ncbi:MAG: class I SAM-dependent methyltransferase [Tepidisphaeraceae bacterium]|jgi:hypothetical protein
MLTRLARATPGLRGELKQLDQLRQEAVRQSQYPPGHYYSTVPDWPAAISQAADHPENVPLPGIDLNEQNQLKLLTLFADSLGPGFWSRGGKLLGPRYSWPNGFFHYTDAALLTHIISHYQPKRIVEVGCGYSSAVVSDALQKANLDLPRGRLLIDPSFQRLKTLIPPEEIGRLTLKETVVQDVDLSEFQSLAPGDILLIDSTHVTKHGSDVNFLVFDVLPRLAAGVVIHFHDVFVPFDYPVQWYRERRGWNEVFLLRAFLQFNADFEIVAFADFLRRRWPTQCAVALGGPAEPTTPDQATAYSSLWLRRK